MLVEQFSLGLNAHLGGQGNRLRMLSLKLQLVLKGLRSRAATDAARAVFVFLDDGDLQKLERALDEAVMQPY